MRILEYPSFHFMGGKRVIRDDDATRCCFVGFEPLILHSASRHCEFFGGVAFVQEDKCP